MLELVPLEEEESFIKNEPILIEEERSLKTKKNKFFLEEINNHEKILWSILNFQNFFDPK